MNLTCQVQIGSLEIIRPGNHRGAHRLTRPLERGGLIPGRETAVDLLYLRNAVRK